MNGIQRIINSHMMEIDTTLAQILTDLIGFNRIIERSLSNASYLVEDDQLSELFMDLAWEKNLLSGQLKVELVHLGNIGTDMIDMERQSFDFDEFEEYSINTYSPDHEFLVNAVLKTETILLNYKSIIEFNDLPESSLNLLRSQREKIKQGLRLMQDRYTKDLVWSRPIVT